MCLHRMSIQTGNLHGIYMDLRILVVGKEIQSVIQGLFNNYVA